MLKEWVRGDHLTLVRNPHYWEAGKPHLDQIVAKEIPQASSRTLALQSGEIDFILSYYFAPNDFRTVLRNPKLSLREAGFAPSDQLMFFNTQRSPTNDRRVRQALVMATDRNYLLQTVWFGLGDVGVSSFDTRVTWAYNPQVDYRKMYPYDLSKAKALLEEAGFKTGSDGRRFTVRILFPSDAPDRIQEAQALKSMWEKIGVNVVLDNLERTAEVKKAFIDNDFEVTLQGYTTYGDPALGIARQFVTASIKKPFGNAGSYSNPEVDKLFEQGQNATSLEERGRYYKQVQVIIARDLPSLTVEESKTYDAASKRVHGVWGGQGYGLWENTWLEP
jgi:peptide/nickel transport system substrate-binding protein